MARRYLTDFHIELEKLEAFDCIVVGAGIAGLYAALSIDDGLKVLVISKSTLEESNSSLAQGGIAAAMSEEDIPVHIQDTLKAGGGYNDLSVVTGMVTDATARIHDILRLGVKLDEDEDGNLKATREGGHSERRILHCKDYTGKAIVEGLLNAALERENIRFLEHAMAVDVLEFDGRTAGILILCDGRLEAIASHSVILATGGIGGLYKATTNAEPLTGDGIAMAIRAQAKLRDMEFIQFHPTAFYDGQQTFLISEAVRGEGGHLVNADGVRFMKHIHPLAELAPRDVVAKAMYDELQVGGAIFLDVRHLDRAFLTGRFPSIYSNCIDAGYDMTRDLIPVQPVQHYIMGGIATDAEGRTNVPGLYVCGEAARTGVHGANRLASNSLLEGLVFAGRVAQQVNMQPRIQKLSGRIESCAEGAAHLVQSVGPAKDIKAQVKRILSESAFIVRNPDLTKKGLDTVSAMLSEMEGQRLDSMEDFEAANMVLVAREILWAAHNRKGSLGSHIICGKDVEH